MIYLKTRSQASVAVVVALVAVVAASVAVVVASVATEAVVVALAVVEVALAVVVVATEVVEVDVVASIAQQLAKTKEASWLSKARRLRSEQFDSLSGCLWL